MRAQPLQIVLQRSQHLYQQRNVDHGHGATERVHRAQQRLVNLDRPSDAPGMALAECLHHADVLFDLAAQDVQQHRVDRRQHRRGNGRGLFGGFPGGGGRSASVFFRFRSVRDTGPGLSLGTSGAGFGTRRLIVRTTVRVPAGLMSSTRADSPSASLSAVCMMALIGAGLASSPFSLASRTKAVPRPHDRPVRSRLRSARCSCRARD